MCVDALATGQVSHECRRDMYFPMAICKLFKSVRDISVTVVTSRLVLCEW